MGEEPQGPNETKQNYLSARPLPNNEHRAPKIAEIRGGRGVSASGPQNTTYARL